MDFLSLWHLAEIGLYGNKHNDGIAAQRGGSRAERPFSYSDAAEIALQSALENSLQNKINIFIVNPLSDNSVIPLFPFASFISRG